MWSQSAMSGCGGCQVVSFASVRSGWCRTDNGTKRQGLLGCDRMKQTLASHPHLLPAFGSALAVYHPGTAEHCDRVGRLARATGAQLRLDESVLDAVHWSGILHDVGKMAVPERVLNKPGRLTPEEWVEVQRHPAVGAALLIAISEGLSPIAEAVRGHHERWDGSGYPDGLTDEDIPLSARIVAVADVFDAMTHHRGYRPKPFAVVETLDHLTDNAGRLYDPAVVEAFLRVHPAAQPTRA